MYPYFFHPLGQTVAVPVTFFVSAPLWQEIVLLTALGVVVGATEFVTGLAHLSCTKAGLEYVSSY